MQLKGTLDELLEPQVLIMTNGRTNEASPISLYFQFLEYRPGPQRIALSWGGQSWVGLGMICRRGCLPQDAGQS